MEIVLFEFWIALAAASIALFFWEEPKTRLLEEHRRKKIETAVARLAKDSRDVRAAMVDFIFSAYDREKEIVMPIRSLLPYRRISYRMIISLLLTIGYFLLTRFPQLDFHIIIFEQISVLVMIAAIVLDTLAGYLVFDEIRYILQVQGDLD